MAEIRFDNRVAIITGAGQGIGKIYAVELAKRGAKVVVNDLGGSRDGSGSDTSAADQVVSEIRSLGGEAVANHDSVASASGGAAIVQTALDAFGGVDILINNAGILRDRSFLKMTEEEWDAVMSVHLKGAFCVTQPAVRAMRDNNYGRIIFTSSISGLYGNFGQTNYSAAKLALVGFMNSLKLEVAKYNILVNTIAPTAWSRMTSDIFPPDYEQKLAPQFNSPMVLYLCSEQNDISGETFAIGGGWYARTAITTAKGAFIGDINHAVTPEDIGGQISGIMDMSQASPLANGMELFERLKPILQK